MSAPVTMALGPFVFRAHGFGYSDMSRELDTSWAELETAGRFNELQWTGPRSDMITVSGVLFPQEFGGDATLQAVKLAAREGVPMLLISLGGAVFGRHAIQGVSEDGTFFDRIGVAGRKSYSIKLKSLSRRSLLSGILGRL